jgi:hypothetical protein
MLGLREQKPKSSQCVYVTSCKVVRLLTAVLWIDDTDVTIRQKCYKSFKEAFPECWKVILTKYHEAQQHVGSAMTIAGWSQAFNKAIKMMQQVVSTILLQFNLSSPHSWLG